MNANPIVSRPDAPVKLTPSQRRVLAFLASAPNANTLFFARRGFGQCYYFEDWHNKHVVARKTWEFLCEQGYVRRTMHGSDLTITDEGRAALGSAVSK